MTDAVDLYQACAEKLLRDPDNPDALSSMFSVLSDDGDLRYGKHYRYLAQRAYQLAPDDITVAFNYGSALVRAGEFKKANEIFTRCAKIAPPEWLARCYHHIGISYRALGMNREAIANYEKSLEIEHKLSVMKDRAIALMATDLQAGFEAFEIRREIAEQVSNNSKYGLVTQRHLPPNVTHWKGEDLTGKSIVVYHEDGCGDFIQFCRYIPKLRELAPSKVLLTGPVPGLLELVAANIPVDGIVPLTEFESDYVIGSMSVPWRVGISEETVSGKPYFKAEPAQIPLRGDLNVGLVWRGNPQYGKDVHRSLAFTEFCPLFDIPGVAFYSLQVGEPAAEVSNYGFDGFVANLEPFATSWTATAGLIQALDLVVTVDTAVAHLAGALGKPVFMMTTNACDWRWHRLNVKTRWYDSMRVYRQHKQDDWSPCITAVRDGIKGMLNGRRSKAA
jgi:hypothetical protein